MLWTYPNNTNSFSPIVNPSCFRFVFRKRSYNSKSGEDRYGRTLGFVFVGDLNVNKELLREGLAWHYKYFNKDEEPAKLEQEARTKKIGLWSQPNPVAPWDFRRK